VFDGCIEGKKDGNAKGGNIVRVKTIPKGVRQGRKGFEIGMERFRMCWIALDLDALSLRC
jgi:hypothetical protein